MHAILVNGRALRRIFSWFKEDAFRRLFLNAGRLLSANGIAALLGFVVTALTARALGPEKYGVLALVLAYEATIGKLVTFNAWQVIIKYGSEALQAGDTAGLRQLIKFGFCLDIGSAVVGTILAMALAGPVVALIGWDQSVQPLLMLYSVLILFGLSGTPVGVLRLFDRFDLLSYTAVLNVLVRLGGVTWCLLTGQDLHGFVLVYLFTGIVGMLYQLFVSLWVLRKQGVSGIPRQSLRGVRSRFPGIWDYVWTTNLNSTVRMLSREADGLILAGLTTPTELGLFKIAKQFSLILPMFSDPLYQSIYPELSKLWAAGNKANFLSLIKRTTLIVSVLAFGGWFLFVVFGKMLIQSIVGIAYQDAYMVTVVYMFAIVIALCTFSFSPAMLSIGLPINLLKALMFATAAYFGLLVVLVSTIGIIGASISYMGFYIIWSTLVFSQLRPYLSKR